MQLDIGEVCRALAFGFISPTLGVYLDVYKKIHVKLW